MGVKRWWVWALLPCPLCGNPDPQDMGHGISCRQCGLWLGNGTRADDFGGYVKLWNTRTPAAPLASITDQLTIKQRGTK